MSNNPFFNLQIIIYILFLFIFWVLDGVVSSMWMFHFFFNIDFQNHLKCFLILTKFYNCKFCVSTFWNIVIEDIFNEFKHLKNTYR